MGDHKPALYLPSHAIQRMRDRHPPAHDMDPAQMADILRRWIASGTEHGGQLNRERVWLVTEADGIGLAVVVSYKWDKMPIVVTVLTVDHVRANSQALTGGCANGQQAATVSRRKKRAADRRRKKRQSALADHGSGDDDAHDDRRPPQHRRSKRPSYP